MNQEKDYGFILLDPDGIIVEWSVGAEHLTRWTATEAVGQLITLIFTPEDRAAGVSEAELRTAQEAGRSPDVRWHLRKDSSRFFVKGVTSAANAGRVQYIPLHAGSQHRRDYIHRTTIRHSWPVAA